jgi:hypothetical protein
VSISQMLNVQAESSENPMTQVNNDDFPPSSSKPESKLSLLSDKP